MKDKVLLSFVMKNIVFSNLGILILSLSYSYISCLQEQRSDGEVRALKNFGEKCSDSDADPCNIRETLACINQTCQCSDPFTMSYDTSRSLCVGRVGHPCVEHASEASVSSNKRNQCVQYSACEINGKNRTCRCWSSFYPDEKGLCARRRGYLQKCDRDEHCDNRKGFTCIEDLGVCACDIKASVYNPDTERCVGLANQDCTNVYRECTENHKCKAGICKCKFKEVETANGTVLCDPIRHKYGKPCGKFRGDCGDEMANLRCLNGKCRCNNPDYQIYDFERRVCVSKVGGPCSLSESEPDLFRNGTNNSKFNPLNFPYIQCIPYAECLPSQFTSHKKTNRNGETSSRGICECGESYIETKKGFCSLPHGAVCDTSSKDKNKDQCSEPLKCVSNACGCQNEIDIYDPDMRKCAKSIGSLCWKDNVCVQKAECVKFARNLPGRCKCRSRFRLTSFGTCV